MISDKKDIRIGVICPSEIAFRRFVPSVKQVSGIEYVGVAVASPEEWAGTADIDEKVNRAIDCEVSKAEKFRDQYGGKIFRGYHTLIESDEVDAVYIPLPPALHAKWAEQVLKNGKHAYVEKPFTTSLEDTQKLLKIAKENNLAVHENYMFIFHDQLSEIRKIIESGELGKIKQYRVSFGFPRRAMSDFRYNRSLGGGALLDAGGYCIKMASWLLGDTATVEYAKLCDDPEFEVDIFGTGVMTNDENTTVLMSFGMDCDYKCDLEAWGNKGTLSTSRILTAPDGFKPEVEIKHNQDYTKLKLADDCAFQKSIKHFIHCVNDKMERIDNYKIIERQSLLLSQFMMQSSNNS